MGEESLFLSGLTQRGSLTASFLDFFFLRFNPRINIRSLDFFISTFQFAYSNKSKCMGDTYNAHIHNTHVCTQLTNAGSVFSSFAITTGLKSVIYKLHLREQHSLTDTRTHTLTHQKPMLSYK